MTALTSVHQLNFHEIQEILKESIYFLQMSVFVVINSYANLRVK